MTKYQSTINDILNEIQKSTHAPLEFTCISTLFFAFCSLITDNSVIGEKTTSAAEEALPSFSGFSGLITPPSVVFGRVSLCLHCLNKLKPI